MGLDLELSELAVIRPIRTAVMSSADGVVTPTRLSDGRDGEEEAADNNGCVTPTAAAVRPVPRQSGDVDDVDAAGCVTPTRGVTSLLPPQQGDDDDNTGCVTPTTATTSLITPRRRGVVSDIDDASLFVTPTSAASVLRPSTECPPAPRKPARSPPVVPKRKLCGGGGKAPRRCFFPVPRDLTKVFVARGGPADSSPRPQQAAKKVRVHPVG